MIRYTAFVGIVILSAASALAAMAPRHYVAANPSNVTVIAKNQAFPVYGPITLEPCNQEDCIDVAQ